MSHFSMMIDSGWVILLRLAYSLLARSREIERYAVFWLHDKIHG
jgi:hypothetical protein